MHARVGQGKDLEAYMAAHRFDYAPQEYQVTRMDSDRLG